MLLPKFKKLGWVIVCGHVSVPAFLESAWEHTRNLGSQAGSTGAPCLMLQGHCLLKGQCIWAVCHFPHPTQTEQKVNAKPYIYAWCCFSSRELKEQLSTSFLHVQQTRSEHLGYRYKVTFCL